MVWSRHSAAAPVIRTTRLAALIALASSVATHGIPLSHHETAHRPDALDHALSGGQVSRHSVPIGTDKAATIVVIHEGIDVVVRVLDSVNRPDLEVSSDAPTGEVRLPLVAAQPGPYTFEIAAAYSKSAPGRYSIRIDDVREPMTRDRQLADALRHDSRADRLRRADSYASALDEAEQALALREAALGPATPELARCLLVLGQLQDGLANFEEAERLYTRAREIVERAPVRNELLRARILDSHAASALARGRFSQGDGLARDALAARERLLGSHHPLVAASLATIADLHHEQANVQEARIAADRAFEIASKSYAATDVALGDFINRVARARIASGDYGRAEELYRQSLEVREAAAGPDSIAAVESLSGLARTALLTNDNVKAEQLHVRSLAIKEKIFGPDHPQVANDLFNLALLHYRRRDYTRALSMYDRALSVYENRLGRAHPLIPRLLNNIGLVHWRLGDYARAGEFYRRALDLSEELFGPESLRLTSALNNLGIIAKETGDYSRAEDLYQRALAITERHLGRDHPGLIAVVESLGILYRDRGDYARGEEMFRRALSITEGSLGAEHRFVARHLDNLVQLNWAAGKWDQAFSNLQRLIAIEERNLPLNLSIGSERQKLAYFEPLLRNLQETIAFQVAHPADDLGARDLAITTLLQRKGRVLDALADNLSAFRRRSTPDDQTLLDQLVRVTSELSAVVMSGSSRMTAAEHQRRTASLAAEREQLEIQVHRRSAGYLEQSRPVRLEEIRSALPADAALLEYSVYHPFNPRASFESGELFGPPRYVVYVIRREGETRWKDLGPANDIDRSVDAFRIALANPTRPGISRLSEDLHRKLIAPLQPLFGDATHLLISPDGPLNLIPFEALRTPDGRFVVETRSVSYLTTGRDLVRLAAARPPAGRSALFANPAFGEPPATAVRSSSTAAQGSGRNTTSVADLSSVYFAPLAGTASEARRIHARFPAMELMVGERATETALKRLQAPRILHIATHGFFLEADAASGSSEVAAPQTADNTLLRSGLALAGANRSRKGADDGILTALEAAQLNLWGTKLVTLSACDTGLGVVKTGEGVYGLRRAFFLAGAESLVMSLWPVSDLITREMMTGYYAALEQGFGRGAALRRIQLQMLKRKGRSHPYYWASFIQAGEWASLDGRR